MAYYIEKQHTCLSCGGVFRYKIDPSSTAASVIRSYDDLVETHPCPTCGYVQPEMAMWTKVLHPITFLVSVFALLVILGVAMGKAGTSHSILAQVSVGLFGLFALVHIGTALSDPNADRDDNLDRAQRAIDRRKLELVTAGDPERKARLPWNFTLWHALALLLVVAGALGFFYPICYPPDVPEPATNPELNPSVVTPGDEVSFTFKKLRVQAINGNVWRGKPTVRVLNAKELGIPETLEAEGSDRQWTTKLQVPHGSRNSTLEPTIRFKIPKNAKLDGKTLRVSINMPVTYAVMRGMDWTFKSTFDDEHATLRESLVVKLVQESALAESRKVFLVGIAGGAVSVLGGLWLTLLAWRLKWHASVSEVVSAPAAPVWQPSSCGAPASAAALDRIDESKWGDRPFRR